MELTPRQLEVLKLVGQGYSDPEIAERLRLHRPMVTLLLRRLMRQLGATSLADFRRKAGAISESAPPIAADPHLTKREAQILHLLASGRTNQQIGKQPLLAPSTVRDHVTQIYRKLRVGTRAQAAVRAVKLGLSSRTQ